MLRNESGVMLSSLLIALFLLTSVSLTLFRYHHNLILWFSTQQILIEAERLAFYQLDIYPDRMIVDRDRWTVKIDCQVMSSNYHVVDVTVEHQKGYKSRQKRIIRINK